MSRPAARPWLVIAGAIAVVALTVLVAARGSAAPPTVQERAQAVASQLRCPVCLNLSVADSPSALAREMRSEILDQLRGGRTEAQVRAFFVARYGEWVLLEPTHRGLNLLPWLFPLVAGLVGAGIWLAVVRRRRRPRPEEAPATDADRRRIERELAALREGL
jgi:cytochrome c-type biogenesis protein CcmH